MISVKNMGSCGPQYGEIRIDDNGSELFFSYWYDRCKNALTASRTDDTAHDLRMAPGTVVLEREHVKLLRDALSRWLGENTEDAGGVSGGLGW